MWCCWEGFSYQGISKSLFNIRPSVEDPHGTDWRGKTTGLTDTKARSCSCSQRKSDNLRWKILRGVFPSFLPPQLIQFIIHCHILKQTGSRNSSHEKTCKSTWWLVRWHWGRKNDQQKTGNGADVPTDGAQMKKNWHQWSWQNGCQLATEKAETCDSTGKFDILEQKKLKTRGNKQSGRWRTKKKRQLINKETHGC